VSFLYSVLLKLLYPTSLSLLLLGAAAVARRSPRFRRACFGLAVAILLVCGNGWVTSALIRHLEQEYLPRQPVPTADAILVLSGGVLGRIPPRPTVEIGEAGDRILYGAELFRQRKAPQIICTGNVATGGVAPRPAAAEMAELLAMLGVPSQAIVKEVQSENTHEHAINVCPLLRDRKIGSVLLVTSAMHMPRSVATFRRLCSSVDFIPAPTDFRAPQSGRSVWYRQLVGLIPTPRNLLDFSDAAHEYLGIAYYRLRGWI
jgi:uncharacterized SAM-binding protein YcdF (DUF218 family)